MSAKKPLVLDFNTGNLQQIQSGDFIDVAQGGTGATTQAGALASLGAYPASNPNNFISASGAPVQSVAGRTGAIVLSQADIGGLTTTSSPTFAAVTAATFTGALAGNATSATNVAGGAANSLVMQTGAGATGFLAAGSNGQVLVISSNTPSWVNFSSLNLTSGQVTSALGYTPADNSKVGAANGIATLGADGKLTTAQIPSSLLGANVYQGVWNANTNTPALNSGVGTKGYYYKVSVAGTTGLDGNSGWQVGDYAIFNGTTWDWIDGGSSEVTTVAGRVGAVVLSQADISGLTTVSSPTFAAVTAATFTGALVGNASSATNIAGGAAYSIPYQTGTGATGFLAAGTSGYVLQTKGTGAAPVWVNAATLSPVQSVAGRTGAVVLAQADISGLTTSSSPTFAGVTAATFTGALAGNAATASAVNTSGKNNSTSSLLIGSPVYADSNSGIQSAIANADSTSDVIGLLAAAAAAGATTPVIDNGELVLTTAQWTAIGGGTSGLVAGASYYLSNSVAGNITTVVPTTGFVIKLGKALSSTKLLVNIGPKIQL